MKNKLYWVTFLLDAAQVWLTVWVGTLILRLSNSYWIFPGAWSFSLYLASVTVLIFSVLRLLFDFLYYLYLNFSGGEEE